MKVEELLQGLVSGAIIAYLTTHGKEIHQWFLDLDWSYHASRFTD